MKIDYKWTDGNNEDFQKFYLKTEEFYSSIVGGLKNREAFVPYNLSESISDVLIALVSGVAVGCAGLKAYSVQGSCPLDSFFFFFISLFTAFKFIPAVSHF